MAGINWIVLKEVRKRIGRDADRATTNYKRKGAESAQKMCKRVSTFLLRL